MPSWSSDGRCLSQVGTRYDEDVGGSRMAQLDWSQCPAVESIPGKVSGAWVLRDTRMPVSVIFENLEYGATIDEITSGRVRQRMR